MKKFLLAAVIMLASTSVFAQHSAGSLTVQPRIGFSAADFNNTDDTKARVGLVVGPEFEYFVTDKFSLAGGVLYSQQGAEIEPLDVTWEIDYLNIPVTANFYVLKGLALKAGVQMGLLTNAKFKSKLHERMEGTSTVTTTTVSEKIRSDCEKMDFSIPIGVSYEFSNHIVVDARYNWGLTKINKEKDFGDKNMKNSVFSASISSRLSWMT